MIAHYGLDYNSIKLATDFVFTSFNHPSTLLTRKIFKLFVFACFLALAAAKPLLSVAYTAPLAAAYTAPIAAAYPAPIAAAYTAPVAYSSYTAAAAYSPYAYSSPYAAYYLR